MCLLGSTIKVKKLAVKIYTTKIGKIVFPVTSIKVKIDLWRHSIKSIKFLNFGVGEDF